MIKYENETLLSSSVTVNLYRKMEKEKNITGITNFVRERIYERYIKPFENNSNKNGFIMMAASCLMIEALESFWMGWRKSPNSSQAFCQFLDRNRRFDDLRGLHKEFYSHVRCGIMHQGETTGGWKIRRDLGKLFDTVTTTIDATIFLEQMNAALSDYCQTLEKSSWDDEIWLNFRKKMKDICANTQAKA